VILPQSLAYDKTSARVEIVPIQPAPEIFFSKMHLLHCARRGSIFTSAPNLSRSNGSGCPITNFVTTNPPLTHSKKPIKPLIVNQLTQSHIAKVLLLSLAFIGLASTGRAQVVVPVANASFEQDMLPAGFTTLARTPVNWGFSSENAGFETDANANINQGTGDGMQLAYTYSPNGYLYQDVGALLPNTEYTLTVAIAPTGNPEQKALQNEASGSDYIGFFNEINNTKTPSGTPLAEDYRTLVSPSTGNSTFSDLTMDYTTGSNVSGDLFVALWTPTTNFVGNFDNVRLTAEAAPEPSTWALLLGAMGALACLARRQHNA
jgi:hypothetical protein